MTLLSLFLRLVVTATLTRSLHVVELNAGPFACSLRCRWNGDFLLAVTVDDLEYLLHHTLRAPLKSNQDDIVAVEADLTMRAFSHSYRSNTERRGEKRIVG